MSKGLYQVHLLPPFGTDVETAYIPTVIGASCGICQEVFMVHAGEMVDVCFDKLEVGAKGHVICPNCVKGIHKGESK